MEPEEYEKMFALEDTHWWFLGKRAFTKTFLDIIAEKEDLNILDVGCGTGGANAILRNYGKFYGIDLRPDAIGRAKKRGIKTLILGSALYLPFQNETFDLVTAFDLLYHRGINDDILALREFNRVCRRGGYILITDSAFDSLRSTHDEATHARHRYTKKEMIDKVNRAGFSVRRISYTNFFLFPVVAAVRLFKRYTNKGDANSDLRRTNPLLNSVLLAVLRIESLILRRVNFPYGSSLICIAKRV